MADLTITATSVLASTNAQTAEGIAGATITAGQAVYVDTADSNKLKLADANSATASIVAGIALNGAAAGQPVEYVTEDDDFTPGATLSISAAAGKGVYVLSDTAGGIKPAGDLAAADYPVVLMVATSATKARFRAKGHRGTAVLTA